MKECIICGSPCHSKYCSQECYLKNERRKYSQKHPKYEKFYVFYDKNDFVRYCGTSEQLVEDGTFSSENAVATKVSRIKSGELSGNVFILNCLVTE